MLYSFSFFFFFFLNPLLERKKIKKYKRKKRNLKKISVVCTEVYVYVVYIDVNILTLRVHEWSCMQNVYTFKKKYVRPYIDIFCPSAFLKIYIYTSRHTSACTYIYVAMNNIDSIYIYIWNIYIYIHIYIKRCIYTYIYTK